jgi:hypothetical protein
MTKPERRNGAYGVRRGSGTRDGPPQNEMPGGLDTPLGLGETGRRSTVKPTGKKHMRDRCSMTAESQGRVAPDGAADAVRFAATGRCSGPRMTVPLRRRTGPPRYR